MSVRKFVSFLAFILMGVGLVTVPAPAAHAVDKKWGYAASTGATYIKVFDGTVSSDYTSNSAINGGGNQTASNSLASINVPGIATVGAVQTRTSAVETAAGTTVTSYARTAGVNLLNGLVSVDALETNASTTGTADDRTFASSTTKLVGIKALGINLPLNIPQNFAVGIPGIATLTANYTLHGSKIDEGGNKVAVTLSWGLGITLLQPFNGIAAGVTILVNPVYHYLSGYVPTTAPSLLGGAYAARIAANVGTAVNVNLDPVAFQPTALGGSNGKTVTNSTASVNVPGVATVGAVTSSSTSTRSDNGDASIVTTSQIGGVNLLGGLVRADAIKVTATSKRVNKVWTHSEEMTLVNVVIAGQSIPINVGPNFVLNVANLGKVEINKRVINNAQLTNAIYGIVITVNASGLGLPVGAVVELAVAGNGIVPTAGN